MWAAPKQDLRRSIGTTPELGQALARSGQFLEEEGLSRLLMRIGEIRTLSDSLTECYSRFSSDAISVILSAHAFNIDLQVKFSHAGNNGLDKRRWLAGH